jgi:hypothetical protein
MNIHIKEYQQENNHPLYRYSKKLSLLGLAATLLIASCSKDDDYDNGGGTPIPPDIKSTVFSAAGDSLGIVGKINEFRAVLGDPLNTTPGQTTGRREVNWDGVPASFTNSNNFPFDFFNNTDPAGPAGRKRGLVYQNTGTSFRVDSTDFKAVDASYEAQFDAFSKKRLFAYMGDNVSIVSFKVPGTSTDASIKGFGLIFSDVDDANSTALEFFNGSKSLGVFKAPARTAQGGFSFLGVYFTEEKVTSVKITSGNGILGTGVKDITDGGSKDLVVMDDFFYDEPKSAN